MLWMVKSRAIGARICASLRVMVTNTSVPAGPSTSSGRVVAGSPEPAAPPSSTGPGFASGLDVASPDPGDAASVHTARHASEQRQSLGTPLGGLPQAESDAAMSAASRNARTLGATSDAMDNEMPG